LKTLKKSLSISIFVEYLIADSLYIFCFLNLLFEKLRKKYSILLLQSNLSKFKIKVAHCSKT